MRAVIPGCSASMTRDAEQTTAKDFPAMRPYSASYVVLPVLRWDSAMPPTSAGTMHPGMVATTMRDRRAARWIGFGVVIGVYPVGLVCPGSGPCVDFIHPRGGGECEHGDDEFGSHCGLDDRSYTRAGECLMRCSPEDHGCEECEECSHRLCEGCGGP